MLVLHGVWFSCLTTCTFEHHNWLNSNTSALVEGRGREMISSDLHSDYASIAKQTKRGLWCLKTYFSFTLMSATPWTCVSCLQSSEANSFLGPGRVGTKTSVWTTVERLATSLRDMIEILSTALVHNMKEDWLHAPQIDREYSVIQKFKKFQFEFNSFRLQTV